MVTIQTTAFNSGLLVDATINHGMWVTSDQWLMKALTRLHLAPGYYPDRDLALAAFVVETLGGMITKRPELPTEETGMVDEGPAPVGHRTSNTQHEKRIALTQIIEADLAAQRFNPNHQPGGSPEGGEFAPAGGTNDSEKYLKNPHAQSMADAPVYKSDPKLYHDRYGAGEGKDALYTFHVLAPVEQVHDKLNSQGFKDHTLHSEGDGTRVYLYSENSSLDGNMGKIGEKYNAEINTIRGTGAFIGGDTREQAHEVYGKIIRDYESGHEPYSGPYRPVQRQVADHNRTKKALTPNLELHQMLLELAVDLNIDLRFNENHDAKGLFTTGGGASPEVHAHIESYKATFPAIMDRFKGAVQGMGKVQGRVKEPDSLAEKLVRKGKTLDQIGDTIGLRVTTPDLKTAYRALDAVNQKFNTLKVDDRMVTPTDGAYRAIHVDVEVDGKKMEIQIRTENQSKLAEYMHGQYKSQDKTPVYHDYVNSVSSALYDRDNGKPAALPPCPPPIKQSFGCYGD